MRALLFAALTLTLAATAVAPAAQIVRVPMMLTVGAGETLPPGTSVVIYERPGSRPISRPPFELNTQTRRDVLIGGGRTTGSYGRTSSVQRVYFVVAQTKAGLLYYSRMVEANGRSDRGFMALQSGQVEMSRIPAALQAPYESLFSADGGASFGEDYQEDDTTIPDGQAVVGAEDFPPILRRLAPIEQMEVLQYARRFAAVQVDSVRRAANADLSQATEAERQRTASNARALEEAEGRARRAEREAQTTHSESTARVNPGSAVLLALLLAALGFALGTTIQRNKLGARAAQAETRVATLEKDGLALRREAKRLSALLKEADVEEATMRASFLDVSTALGAARSDLERAEARYAEAQRAVREGTPTPYAPKPVPPPSAPSPANQAAEDTGSPPEGYRPSLRSLLSNTKLGKAILPPTPPPPTADIFDDILTSDLDEEAAYAEAEDEHDKALAQRIGQAFATWCREPGPRLPRYYMFERKLRETLSEAEVYPLFLNNEEQLERHATGGSEFWGVEVNGATFALPAPRSARGFRGLAPVFDSPESIRPEDVAEVVPARLAGDGSKLVVVQSGRLQP